MEIAEIRNFIKWSGVMTSVCYLLMLGVGVLIGYIYTNTMNKGYYIQDYISSVNVDMLKIFLYHLTNYIMFIPILLRFVYLIYLTIMGSIT